VQVDVEFQERYWYPDDGGEVWVAGYYPIDPSGRFLARDALPDGLIVSHVAGANHRPEPLASEEAAPGRPLTLRPEPENPRDLAPAVRDGWSAVVLRERRDTPRDPRTGLTMLLARGGAVELRVR
jgi:hypothetical protein